MTAVEMLRCGSRLLGSKIREKLMLAIQINIGTVCKANASPTLTAAW